MCASLRGLECELDECRIRMQMTAIFKRIASDLDNFAGQSLYILLDRFQAGL